MAGISTIAESIVRILKTPLGSRVMRPNYGSKLYELRDRKFDDKFKALATKYIFESISLNEPRVKVKNIDFKIDAVSGKISFLIYLINQNMMIEVVND